MARCLPQIEIEHVWSDYFLEASDSVLFFNHIHEVVVDFSTFRVPECTTG